MLCQLKASAKLAPVYKDHLDAYVDHLKRGCPEGDGGLNDSNFALIEGAYKEFPEVWLVKVHGKEGVYIWQYKGEQLYNFCCEAVLTSYDEKLDSLLKEKDYRTGIKRLAELDALLLGFS